MKNYNNIISVLTSSFEERKLVKEKLHSLGVKPSTLLELLCDEAEAKLGSLYFSFFKDDVSFCYTPIDSYYVKDLRLVSLEEFLKFKNA